MPALKTTNDNRNGFSCHQVCVIYSPLSLPSPTQQKEELSLVFGPLPGTIMLPFRALLFPGDVGEAAYLLLSTSPAAEVAGVRTSAGGFMQEGVSPAVTDRSNLSSSLTANTQQPSASRPKRPDQSISSLLSQALAPQPECSALPKRCLSARSCTWKSFNWSELF